MEGTFAEGLAAGSFALEKQAAGTSVVGRTAASALGGGARNGDLRRGVGPTRNGWIPS